MRGSTKTMTQDKKLDGIHRPNNSVYEQRSNDDERTAVASDCAKNIVASVVAKASGKNSNSKKKRPSQSGLASKSIAVASPFNKSAIGKVSLVECSVPATNRQQVETRDRNKNSKNRGSVNSRKTPAVGNQSGGQSVHDDNRKPVEMTVITQQNGNDAIRDIQSNIDYNTVDKISAPRSVINASNRDVVSKVENINFHSEKPINIDLQVDRANSGKIPSDENTTTNVTQQADANDDLEPLQEHKIGGKFDEKLSETLEATGDHQVAPTEEDPMARLNALRANIANALKEVKAVLEQHAPPAEGNDENASATNETEQDGCVNFRFVRRSRTKSIIKFDDEEIVCNVPTPIAETTASTEENQQKSDTKRNLSPKSKSSETAKAEQIKDEGHLKDNLEQLQVTPTYTTAAKSPDSQEKELQSESVKAKQLVNESKNDNAKHFPLKEPKKNFSKAEALAILKREESKDERGKVDVNKAKPFQTEIRAPDEIDNEAIPSTDRQIVLKSTKQDKEGLSKDQDKISEESIIKSQKSKDNHDETSQKENNAIKKPGRQLTPESKNKSITTKVPHQEIKGKEVAKLEEPAKLKRASPKLIQKKLEYKSKEEISPPKPDERKRIAGNKESLKSGQESSLPKEATKDKQAEPTKIKAASIVSQKSNETSSVASKGGIKKQQPKELPKTKDDQVSSTEQSSPKFQEIIVKQSSSELPKESGTKTINKEQTSTDKPELVKEAGIRKAAEIKESAAPEFSSKKIEEPKSQQNKDVPDKKIEVSKVKTTKQNDNSELQPKQAIKTQEGEIPKLNELANTAKTKEAISPKLPVKQTEESNKPTEIEATKSDAPKTIKKLPSKKILSVEEKPKSPVVTLRAKRASLTETRRSAIKTVKPKRASITEGDLAKLSQQTDAQIAPVKIDGNTTAPKSVGKPPRDDNENIVKLAHATTDNISIQPTITKTESSSVKYFKLPTATVAITVPAIATATSKATTSNSKPTTVAETTQANNAQSKQITQPSAPPPQPVLSPLKTNDAKLVGTSQNQKSSDVITPLISSVVDKIPAKSSASVERPTVNSRSSEMTVVKKDCSNIAPKPALVLDEKLKSDPLIKQTDNRDYEVLKKVPVVSPVEPIVSLKNVKALPPDVMLQKDIRPNDVGVILNSVSNHTPVLTRAPSIDLKDAPPQMAKTEMIIPSKVPDKLEADNSKESKDIQNSTPKLESLRIDAPPKVAEQSESTKPPTTGDTKDDKITPAEVKVPKKEETPTKVVDKVETDNPVLDINDSNKTPMAITDFKVISNQKDVVQKNIPEIENHEPSNQKGSFSTDPLTALAAGLDKKPPHIPASIKTDLTESTAPLKTPDSPATPESPIPPDSPSPLIETTTETTDTENEATTKKPAKKRKMKKVIIKRIKRRLSRDETIDKPEVCEKPIAEPPIPSKEAETATEPEPEQPVVEEPLVPKGPRSCLVRRSYEPGDIVMYADRIRKLVKWRKATVLEKITDISYKLEFESGDQKPAHISYIKKFTDKKVQFGGKEYLEIDYEQENQESEEDEPYNIWARV